MARRLLCGAFLGLACVIASAAAALGDGLPVLGVSAGPGGIAAPAGGVRFVTLPAGGNTVVAQVERRDGFVTRSRLLHGVFAVPVVAFDGSASGVSDDGRTLVLVRPRLRFPRATTTFAILDARRLRLRSVFTLRGDFSFDAVSPRGHRLYLIQYLSGQDPTRYAVRAYDVAGRRLLPAPIVDPKERGDEMRGLPLTRATSPGGRWAYTLYDGAGKEPFVHALDTARGRAVCIDLPTLRGRNDLYALRLAVGGSGVRLTVASSRAPLAVIDTRTFRVGRPTAAGAAAPARGEGSWRIWALAAAGALAAAALVAVVVYRRRRPVSVVVAQR